MHSLIPLNHEFLKAIQFNLEENINCVEIIDFDCKPLSHDFYGYQKNEFVIFINKEIATSSHETLFEYLVKWLVHPKYYLEFGNPVIIVGERISDTFICSLIDYLKSFGYTSVSFIKILNSIDESPLVEMSNEKNKNIPIINFSKLCIEKISLDTISDGNYIILRSTNIKAFLNALWERRMNVKSLMKRKFLQYECANLRQELSWKNKQLENHKMYLEAIKSDRSLMLFVKIESFIKRISWLRKMLKKLLINKK